MKTTYNIQVSVPGLGWEDTPARHLDFKTRKEAVEFCSKLSHVVGKEIRLTTGNYKLESGSYIKSTL